MARTMRGCTTVQLQTRGAEEPETDPQQDEQPDATEGKVIVGYNPDIDYERLEPKNEPLAQAEKEENTDAKFTNMEIPQAETFYQRMMPCNVVQRISRYIKEEDLRLWPHGSRICTYTAGIQS